MAQETLAERRRYWQTQVKAWQASGLGATAFARERGLNPRTFLYWRHSLRREEQARRAAGQVPLFQRLEVVTRPLGQATPEVPESSASPSETEERPDGSLLLEPVARPLPEVLGSVVRDGTIRCQVHLPNGTLVELSGRLEATLLGNLLQVAGTLPITTAAVVGGRL